MSPDVHVSPGSDPWGPDRVNPGQGARATPPTPPPVTPPAAPDEQIEMLRDITRQIATAEDLELALRSIVSALVARADALLARIFLLMSDRECPICRERIEAGTQPETDERVLHLAAAAGLHSELGSILHRLPLDAPLPVAEVMRTRWPILVKDWRKQDRFTSVPRLVEVWNAMGVEALAAYPLDFRGELLGSVAYLARRPIDPREFELLGIFADQAAMTIASAYLFREAQQYRERLEQENAYLQEEVRADYSIEGIVGESAALRGVLRKVRQVAHVETTVLLTGETGTGKELVARAIHEGSPRRERAMIKVNCGAIPRDLVESELFGHEKGAFTGAVQKRVGRFELAEGGTLFMDEVGELPLDTQVKLLRVLQEREFERVGSTRSMKADVRLVAATNRDLEREVAEGRFRPDLYYRLNVFPIRIPPLRERPEDIPALVRHFLAQFQRKLAKPLKALTPESLDRLQRYAWPGNIRELQNVLERACVLARGPEVEVAETFLAAVGRGAAVAAAAAPARPLVTLDENERRSIERALASVNGRVHGPHGAAALLGVNPSTLRSRMQKLGIGKRSS